VICKHHALKYDDSNYVVVIGEVFVDGDEKGEWWTVDVTDTSEFVVICDSCMKRLKGGDE
jgi:hypothetical protein